MNISDLLRNGPNSIARLPRLVRMYIVQCLIGFALAAFFTVAVIFFDVAGIGRLVATVSGGALAAFVFFVLNGIVFAALQMSIAIMGLADSDRSPGGGLRAPITKGLPDMTPAQSIMDSAKPGHRCNLRYC